LSEQDVIERAFRAIDELAGKQTVPVPSPKISNVTVPLVRDVVLVAKPFPRCPACLSYYLYRQNNIRNYECMTCGLLDITEEAARRGRVN
jgi:hypothetical protein